MISQPSIKVTRYCCTLLTTAIFVGCCSYANATDQLTAGTSARKIRQKAVQAIPMQQLTPQTRALITPIIEKPSIYRRLPVTAIDVDPDYFLYLVRYPEVVVNIWQIMGITDMELERKGPFQLKSNDGAGAKSDIELIYGTNNLNIYYAKGSYAGPLLKRHLEGSCVLVLRTDYRKGANGKPQAVSSLDVFLKVENVTANLIAKTVNPIVGSTADHNFVESMNFLQRLNETTEKNGYGVQRMADRLTNLSPDVRKGFVNAAGMVYQRNHPRPARSQSTPPTKNAGFEVPFGTNGNTTRPRQRVLPASGMQNSSQPGRVNRASWPTTTPTMSRGVNPASHYQQRPQSAHLANPVFYDANQRNIRPPVQYSGFPYHR